MSDDMQIWCNILSAINLSLILVLGTYGFHRCWILYLYYRYYKLRNPEPTPEWKGTLPRVTVQLPIFNERYVVERLIESVCHLEYPRDLLEIQVLDDSTDDTTALAGAKAEAMRRQGFHIALFHRTHRVGFKAGALATGMEQSQGDFFAIFDADFLPPANFLVQTLPFFGDSRVGMVQARWGHLNQDHSLLTRVQSIFLDGHFAFEQTARNRSGVFFNFNGTAGIWRREAIISSGGWHHDTLTEDLDLSYRAQMLGWRFVYLPNVVCPAELPVDIHAFKTQQNRWTIGAIQTAKKMLPAIWRSALPLKVKTEATFHLTACVGYLLMAVLSLIFPLSLFFRTQNHWFLTRLVERFFLIGTTLSVVLFYAICQRELYAGWKTRIRSLPFLISVGAGICLTNTKAVLEGLVGKHFEFRRTSKYSVAARDGSWKNKLYRAGNPLGGVLEIIFAGYFLVAAGVAWRTHQWTSVPFIALFGFGYLYVALLSMVHGTSWGMSRLTTLPTKNCPTL